MFYTVLKYFHTEFKAQSPISWTFCLVLLTSWQLFSVVCVPLFLQGCFFLLRQELTWMVSIELAVLDSYRKRVQYKRQLYKNIEQYRRNLLLNRERLHFEWFFFCKALLYLLYHGLQINAHNYMMTVWLILKRIEVAVMLLTWSWLGGSFL